MREHWIPSSEDCFFVLVVVFFLYLTSTVFSWPGSEWCVSQESSYFLKGKQKVLCTGSFLWFPICVSAVGVGELLWFCNTVCHILVLEVLSSTQEGCWEHSSGIENPLVDDSKQCLWHVKFRWAQKAMPVCSKSILHSACVLIRSLRLLFSSLSGMMHSVCILSNHGEWQTEEL